MIKKRPTIFPLALFLLAIAALAFIIDLRTLLRFPARDANSLFWPNTELPGVSAYPFPAGYTVPAPRSATDVLTVHISLDILISGLENNDTVEIQLAPANELTTSAVKMTGITLPNLRLHSQIRTIDLLAVPVGFYQLTLSAPPSYFREPLGYLFQVQENGIVNRRGFPLPFTLIPASAQDLPPCRNVASMPAYPLPSVEITGDIPIDESQDVCRAEGMIDLSSPPKLPEQQNIGEVTQITSQTTLVAPTTGTSSIQETDPLIALSESIMDTRYYDGIIVISQYYTFLGYGLYAEAYQLLSESAQSPHSLEDYVVNMGLAFQEVEIVAVLPFYVAVEGQGGHARPDREYRMRFAVQIRAWGEGGMSGSRLNGVLQELFLELILEDGSWKINTFATAPLP